MIQDGKVRFFIPPDLIEPDALAQVRNTASMPFVRGLAVMPDVHFGMGSTVGTVVATEGAVMPACVGVDIGCGMIAARTSLTLREVWPHKQAIREGIERRIPVGIGDFGLNSRIHPSAQERIDALEDLAVGWWDNPAHMDMRDGKWRRALGTLGGGNHFIEVCALDSESIEAGPDEGDMPVWVILHSGSRGVGNKTGTHWTRAARARCSGDPNMPDVNLAWLETGTWEFQEYMNEVQWCQQFALLSREEMLERVLRELEYTVRGNNVGDLVAGHYCGSDCPSIVVDERVNCHHNYVEPQDGLLVTRKGAVSARAGQRALIPGSMGTNSYVVEGLGNADSYFSAPHGAGRRMSRTRAKKEFTVEQVAAQLASRGIEARVRAAIIDEAPGAYKDIEETMRHASDLVRPLHCLRQIVNVKGD